MSESPPEIPDAPLDGEVEVEATINLPGLRAGERAMIPAAELDSDYVVACLAKGYVVVVE